MEKAFDRTEKHRHDERGGNRGLYSKLEEFQGLTSHYQNPGSNISSHCFWPWASVTASLGSISAGQTNSADLVDGLA